MSRRQTEGGDDHVEPGDVKVPTLSIEIYINPPTFDESGVGLSENLFVDQPETIDPSSWEDIQFEKAEDMDFQTYTGTNGLL